MALVQRRLHNRPLLWAMALLAAGAIAFGLYWFEPQALLFDQTVDEAPPAVASSEAIAGGEFQGLAHTVEGEAQILVSAGGDRILRLQDFSVDNGPDLKVYLSTAPFAAGSDYAQEFVSLGDLKGNIGNQNYEIPSNVDVSRFQSIVIWCERFAVGFAAAPLR
jgi:hypothetical protein